MKSIPFLVAALVSLAICGCGKNGDAPLANQNKGEKNVVAGDPKKDSQCLVSAWKETYNSDSNRWRRFHLSCTDESKEACEKKFRKTRDDVEIVQETKMDHLGQVVPVEKSFKVYAIFDGPTDREWQKKWHCDIEVKEGELKPLITPIAFAQKSSIRGGESNASDEYLLVQWGCYASCDRLKQPKPATP